MKEIMKNRYELVCEEGPVELFVNGQRLLTFMCTPENLRELALGHMYSRQLIHSVEDVLTLGACDDVKKIFATTANPLPTEDYGLGSVLASGCGSGTVFSESFLEKNRNPSEITVSLEKLQDLTMQMFRRAQGYKTTGGFHSAALVSGEEIVALYEDVGRHNAVDKAIGKGMFLEVDFMQSVMITTGRISSDMILKAVASNIPIVVSRSIPTSLALEIAEKMGITIVGRITNKEPIVFTGSHRMIYENRQTACM
jgi:FdhD protein